MRKQIVIVGGGKGGTMVANRLCRRFDTPEAEIHVVDQDDWHVYQPGLLFVPFGLAHPDDIVRPRRHQLRGGITFHENEVESVSIEHDEVLLRDGTVLPYARLKADETDVLVVATGASEGRGWNERAFSFFTPDGADQLHRALESFDRGRLVVNLVDMPIKCPVAPLEFAFLAGWSRRRLAQLPEELDAGSQALAPREETDRDQPGEGYRHERARVPAERTQIVGEQQSLGGKLLTDLLGAALSHGFPRSSPSAPPRRWLRWARPAPPSGRTAPPQNRK